MEGLWCAETSLWLFNGLRQIKHVTYFNFPPYCVYHETWVMYTNKTKTEQNFIKLSAYRWKSIHKYPLRFKSEIEQIGHTAIKHPVGWYFFSLTSSDHKYGDYHQPQVSAVGRKSRGPKRREPSLTIRCQTVSRLSYGSGQDNLTCGELLTLYWNVIFRHTLWSFLQ